MYGMDKGLVDSLFRKKNVVGVGLGEKWSGGVNTGVGAVLVFVSKKEDRSRLGSLDLVPDFVGGLPSDVVGRCGRVVAFGNVGRVGRVRPVVPGCSCGHLWVTAGTVGGFFKCGGCVVGLSNNHVLAAVNRGVCWNGKRGHWVVQPGVYDDGGWGGNRVGWLKDFVRLGGGGNCQDSAIFVLEDQGGFVSCIPGVGDVVGWNDGVVVGDVLRKFGRTTGFTSGRVIAVDVSIVVDYGGGLRFRFVDQVVTDAMSSGGDSGSLSVDSGGRAVGLVFAGSGAVTVHNRIKYPRESYGLELICPLVESLDYSLVVDGVVSDFSVGDCVQLVSYAKSLASGGRDVDLNVCYSARRNV